MKIAFYTEPGTVKRGDNTHLPPGTECHKEFRTVGSLCRALRNSEWDLIVVGWNLHDVQGSDLLRTVLASFPTRPAVVFLTAHDTPEDIVEVLNGGATDYILAPISAAVLQARLAAIFRLVGPKVERQPATVPTDEHSRVHFGEYVFHRRHHYVDIRGKRIALRPKEYILAQLLFQNIGTAITREQLHWALWGNMESFPSRTLDTHLSRLRTKLQLGRDSGLEIKQIRRIGYRLVCC